MAASSKFSYKVCRLFCENRVIGIGRSSLQFDRKSIAFLWKKCLKVRWALLLIWLRNIVDGSLERRNPVELNKNAFEVLVNIPGE